MPPKSPMTTSTRTLKPRLSAAERRAAQVAGLATQQSDLKREAAERRLAREQRDASSAAAGSSATA